MHGPYAAKRLAYRRSIDHIVESQPCAQFFPLKPSLKPSQYCGQPRRAMSPNYVAGYGYSPTVHFQQWYWPFGPSLDYILHHYCAKQYDYYVNSNGTCPQLTPSDLPIPGGALFAPGGTDCTAQPVVRCLLHHTDELSKADFAAAQLLLGLIPTILSFAGSTTAELGLLGMRRPLLMLLISSGTPTTNPMRTFEYRSPVHIIKPHPDGFKLSEIPLYLRPLISSVEYVVALATMANLGMIVYEVTMKTVNSVAVGDIWLMTSKSFRRIRVQYEQPI